LVLAASLAALVACSGEAPPPAAAPAQPPRIVGTDEPFAAHAVYFVLTDRFVNGDPGNDHRDQGGALRTFDLPTPGAPPGESDNVGYLGGDFRGLLDQADYIREMGFGAVWITPIVDNPDEQFSGGDPVAWKGFFTDRGKSGYHGYWGVNFFVEDEHLPSEGLHFREFSDGMRAKGLKTVLDIVANHGSPSFTMPEDQPKFGEIYDRDGQLVADHQNLEPEQLDPAGNPLHAFFFAKKDLAQLSNIDDTNPATLDYFVDAYSHWIDEGADAFRIDTIRHVGLPFWKQFSDRIRAKRPGFFMFGEAFDHDANNIAPFTLAENGAVSVLDFPLKAAMVKVFGRDDADYAEIAPALFLSDGPYRNVYELMTFYDNHDMARLDADDAGFIDAHNFLFTARGIPVVYYGSESGFMRGTGEHAGNRNYFGVEGIAAARQHPIRRALVEIAQARRDSVALQRGVQVPIEMGGERAAFWRVYQDGERHQIALVLLNKGDTATTFTLADVQAGAWRSALDAGTHVVDAGGALAVEVGAHDVEVLLLDAAVTAPGLVDYFAPQDRRTTNCAGSIWLPMLSPRTSLTSVSTSSSPARLVSCSTVVSGGFT
jgi:cyclomaltodextrin glucanotransferase